VKISKSKTLYRLCLLMFAQLIRPRH